MSTNLEIEVKAKLNAEQYERIISNFKTSKIYLQINYYIDTKNLEIRNQNCGLRIRQIKDAFELTIKVPQKEGKLEINQQISNISFANLENNGLFPTGEVATFIEQNLGLRISDLHILGKLETYRLDVKYGTSLISIDKSIYNSHVDYEVEAEDDSEENAIKNIKKFLADFGIEFHKFTKSKLRRFLETLS